MKTAPGLILGVLLLLVVHGCTENAVNDDVVARVGSATLTRSQLKEMWSERMVRSDSAAVATASVDQWITRELLYQEALRRQLHTDSLIRQQIEENRRSVLIASLLEELYAEETSDPDPSAVETWYQQHTGSLILREPYIRVWYLPVDSAEWSQDIELRMEEAESDSAFLRLVETYSALKEQSLYFASGILPISLVFPQNADLRAAIAGTNEGGTVAPYSDSGLVHAIKVVQRVEAGTVPAMEMILPEIERRILIESRKQLFARQVQRLRTAAEARNGLFIRQ